MFRDRDEPESAALFLHNWELEVRAGFTPEHELDALGRLNEDYLDPDEDPALEANLIADVSAAAAPILRRAREEESTWPAVTMNDRLTAAFAALGQRGILARECFGTTIQDGWAYVGLAPEYRGAVFYHREDVLDALDGQSLLVAFGGSGERTSTAAADAAVAEQALAALAEFGIAAAWSGRAEDRIAIAPFIWQRRRWTRPSANLDGAAVPWMRTAQQLSLLSLSGDACLTYQTSVVARRTGYAFDRWLSAAMRNAWSSLGGERGQFGHTGEPYAFLPTGELTTVAPLNALVNLAPEESAALRRAGIERRR